MAIEMTHEDDEFYGVKGAGMSHRISSYGDDKRSQLIDFFRSQGKSEAQIEKLIGTEKKSAIRRRKYSR